MIKNQIVRHWVPTLFCAFLVYINLRDQAGGWQSISIWLPMCFFYVSTISYSMQKQMKELQAQIDELRRQAVAHPGA